MNNALEQQLVELLLDANYHLRAATDAQKKAQELLRSNGLLGNYHLGIIESVQPKETPEGVSEEKKE